MTNEYDRGYKILANDSLHPNIDKIDFIHLLCMCN
jgi:hypothetical protein